MPASIHGVLSRQLRGGSTGAYMKFLQSKSVSRRQSESELRVSNEKLRGLFELSPLGIALTDMQGRFVEYNDAFLQICGYPDDELNALDYWDLTPREYAEQEALQLQSLEKYGRYGPYEKEYLQKDGTRIPLRLNGLLITGQDGERYIWSIVEDISERRRVDAQIAKSRALLEAISRAQSEFITASDHRVTFDTLLSTLLAYSDSECGIIGEVLRDVQGAPYLKAHAIANIAGDGTTRAFFETMAGPSLELHALDNLFGAVLASGERVIANDPQHDPRSGNMPAGPQQIRAFLGLPLYKGRELIGMIGIANRSSGYDEGFCDELLPLTSTCAGLIESWRGVTLRKMAESALEQSNQRFKTVLQAVPDLMFELDRNGRYLNVWGIRGDLLAAPEQQLLGHTVDEMLPPAAAQIVMEAIRDADISGHSSGRRIALPLPCGVSWFELSVAKQPSATETRFIVLSRDITSRKVGEEALQLAASVYHASHEGILVTDENNLIIDVNPAFTRITGYQPDEVIGNNPGLFSSGRHDAEFYRQMWQAIELDGHWQGEIWDKRRDGEIHAKWLSISVVRDAEGRVFRYVAQFSDITEKKRQDEQIWTQANFDTLTGLPNRRLLADRMQQVMSAATRSGMQAALLSLDLDHFKRLNDTFGHSMGDRLLVEVARRLRASVRDEDTVARMGGDEFIVVLHELGCDLAEAAQHAELVAEKIRAELSRPYQLSDTEYHTSSSIGIVLFCGQLESQEELLAHVDVAMYQAKSKGRNGICFFDQSMQIALEKRSQLEAALRVALVRGELKLYYQLQIDDQGRPVGAEALLRWFHPQLGMVSPANFIPVAEDTGMILPIGHWVLETACEQLALWQQDEKLGALTIAVNVSSRQFGDAAFVEQVCGILENAGIRPEVLKLELTESLVLENVEETIAKMRELKGLGVKFSMDDFGTGYSSLSYLTRLPIDQLKIDQSFVRNISTDKNAAAIVHTIISMAHSLGLDVIAEGVETQVQREFLESRGCRAYQGYLYAKPLPVDELERKLACLW